VAFYENDVGIHIDEARLQARVRELGAAITRDYQGK
jgi:hypoxanthine phosphoribosyltransferase